MFLKKVFTVNSGIELKPQSVTLAAEEFALSSGFPKMIIAHNHSDGRMIPSAEDRVISRTLSERLRGHGIELCAHISCRAWIIRSLIFDLRRIDK